MVFTDLDRYCVDHALIRLRGFGICLVLLSGSLSVLWGYFLGQTVSGGPIDFQAIYYGSRTLIQHHNPYRMNEMEAVLRQSGGETPTDTPRHRRAIILYVNLPPTLLLIAPFTLLPLPFAQALWMAMTAAILLIAAFLMWRSGSSNAPILSACLIAFSLANCQFVFGTGNTAGIVVGLCVIAAWCFITNRFVLTGVLCMAVSLAIKPHDSGLVWLYFILAAAVTRKRAWQSAALAAVLALPAVLWVAHVVPNWIHDWHANMMTIAAPGGLNDPSPALELVNSAQSVVSLQRLFSVISDRQDFYNYATYLVCGPLILLWAISTLRSRFSQERAWLAMAAIAPLTVLVTYHRIYDAKLLLLTVPACAILWAGRGLTGWIAVLLNAVGFFVNGDVPITMLNQATQNLHLSFATLPAKLELILLARPNQLVLLAMCIFYLWIYVRYVPAPAASTGSEASANDPLTERKPLASIAIVS